MGNFIVKPRYYQTEAVDAMLACKDNGVVVLPTASGKSFVLRMFCEQFKGKVLILSHVREILIQDFDCLAGLPDVGLYSAGLDMRVIGRVTVAGIQSVWKLGRLFKDFDIVLIDECHLVNNAGMYKKLLDRLNVQYIGLTATDFRLKGGYIHGRRGMFDSVCYEAKVDKLTDEGYLCPLEFKGDVEAMDITGIKTTGGDYNLKEMSLRFNRKVVTNRIVEKIAKYEAKHILIFCIDINHAEQVSAALNRSGIPSLAVHSKSPRDQALLDFKAGKVRAIANVNVLTTGFDFPAIDMIVLLRPTKSMSLHQQMLGRGMRLHESKTVTIVKDFTENTVTLGTVREPAPLTGTGDGKGKGGDNPFLKTCPECETICHPAVRICECGYKFKFEHNLSLTAKVVKPNVEWHDVTAVLYNIHHKPGSPNSLKVSYMCGLRVFNEWVLLDHSGYASHKARHWVSRRWLGTLDAPTTTKGLYAECDSIKKPVRLRVDDAGKFPKIMSMI